jgi:hypothetical protein
MTLNSAPDISDWDLLLVDNDDDLFVSEEMSDIIEIFSIPDSSATSISSACNEIRNSLEDYYINSEEEDSLFAKLEDLYETDTTSTQPTDPDLNHEEPIQQDSSPTTIPSYPPEFDQLQNLPYEIVERPRYVSSCFHSQLAPGFENISNPCSTT